MWLNPQETSYLVTFTEEILMENVIFCKVFLLLLRQIFELLKGVHFSECILLEGSNL